MAREFEPVTPTEFQSPDQLPPEKRWRFRTAYVLLLALALITALILYFLLSAKAILFKVNPEFAQIEIKGGLAFPIGESRLMLRGDYEVEISAQGFETIIDSFAIDSDTPPERTYQMMPLPGNLRVSLLGDARIGSEEEISASATISGNDLAEPISIDASSDLLFADLPAGNYQLRLDANLYAEKTIEVEVPGRGLTEEIKVELDPVWGWVALESVTAAPDIYVDGVVTEALIDTAADAVSLRTRVEAGKREIQIVLENYKPVVREISMEPEQELDLGLIELEHVDSKVSVQTDPPGVSVLVNQNYAGETPVLLDLLPDTNHKIELFRAGYQSRTENIQVERNSEITLAYELKPDLVQVSLSMHPQNADLRISGKSVSSRNGQISLPAIKHMVEVSAPGYESQTLEFLPIRGSRQHLQVRLLTTEQALWAKIPPKYRSPLGQELKLFRDAGEVTMGSSRRETGRRANETTWTATLERPFYVSLTEVTNQQYKTFDPEHSSGHFEGFSLDGADQPVINISWQQAALYCNWLSEQEGLEPFYTTVRGFVSGHNPESTGYRLLTEAEWTWLAKVNSSGFSQKYIWGDSDELPSALENYADQSVAGLINFTLAGVNDSYATTAPVGSFQANSKGMYDLSGNVNEWIHDWYDASPYKPDETVIDPLGPDEGEFHVIRGASWARGYLPQLRLAYRDYDSTGRNDLGFRIARYAM